jgi:hypothetical protein
MSDTDEIARLRALWCEEKSKAMTFHAEVERLRADLAQRTAEVAKAIADRDEAVDALKRIATYDYRGNQSGESQIARHALIAMRKGDGDGK